MLLAGHPRGVRDLSFAEYLDVAWAHYLRILGSANGWVDPFDLRHRLTFALYGGEVPVEREERDADDRPRASSNTPRRTPPPSKLAQLRRFRESRLETAERLNTQGATNITPSG